MTTDAPRTDDLDRFCELAELGAGLACDALGRLLEAEIRHRPPSLHETTDLTSADRWSTGVVFEVAGDVDGLVAIILPAASAENAIERMLGRSDAPDEIAESALRELGNILASHAVSAMADALAATVMLSVPTLAMRDAGTVLGSLIADRGAAARIEVELCGTDGDAAALLIFVPDPGKPGEL
jgi:chemotaxis protein CheC